MQCDKIALISHFIRLLPYLLKTQFVFTVFQQTKWTQKTQTGLPAHQGKQYSPRCSLSTEPLPIFEYVDYITQEV